METIKDLDQHTVCTADPFRGLIVRKTKRENIMIYLPVGGEITFTIESNCTIVRREGHSLMHVNRYHLPPD